MGVKHLKEPPIFKDPVCYVTVSGNVVDVVKTDSNRKQTIQKIDADRYINLDSGEIGVYEKSECRKNNQQSVYRSLKRLRQIINANVTDKDKIRWVTLTYAENMTDTKRLYQDYRKFWQRFKRYCKNQDYGNVEYILANEPQGRGAWHMHIFFIFDKTAPFIENKVLAEIWQHGFVSIKSIDGNIDNIGAYLSAYLGDMEVSEDKYKEYTQFFDVNNIKTIQGEKVNKYVLKGARLSLYPVGFPIYKHSRGIKEPEKIKTNLNGLKKIVGVASPTYEKNYEIECNNTEKIYQCQVSIQQYKLKKVK